MGTVTVKWIESSLMIGTDSAGRPLTINRVLPILFLIFLGHWIRHTHF